MTPTMLARVDANVEILALPDRTHFILDAISFYEQELAARRGETWAKLPVMQEKRAYFGKMRARDTHELAKATREERATRETRRKARQARQRRGLSY